MKHLLLTLAAIAAFSCRTAAITPEARFERLESQLLQATSDIEFAIASSGAVDTAVNGSIYIGRTDVRIEATGTVMNDKTSAVYVTNDERRPADVKRAVVIGWTRMGLLHNLVRLLGEQDIDHGSGGVSDWVKVSNVEWDEAERRFTFDIAVGGRDVARARLWLDNRGRPLRRDQTVNFPGGTMQVEERYQWR